MNSQTPISIHINPQKILTQNFPLSEGDIVADLGCGQHGFFTFPASKIVGKNGKVYAVDILERVLRQISKRKKEENVENIEIKYTNLEKFGALNINNNSVDKVLLVNTLFQNKKWRDILKEASRLIKEKGEILIIDWVPGRTQAGPQVEHRINPEDIKDEMEKLGFILKDQFSPSTFHFGLVFKKV